MSDGDEVRTSSDTIPAEPIRLAHSIELARLETYALESVLRNDAMDEDVRVGKGLLLKVGSALLQLERVAEADAKVTIVLTQREAWAARDAVPITMQMGQAPVGLSLKRKLYVVILEYDTEDEAKGLLLELNRSEERRRENMRRADEEAARQVRDKVEAEVGRGSARSGPPDPTAEVTEGVLHPRRSGRRHKGRNRMSTKKESPTNAGSDEHTNSD